jgi:hypothetical protein
MMNATQDTQLDRSAYAPCSTTRRVGSLGSERFVKTAVLRKESRSNACLTFCSSYVPVAWLPGASLHLVKIPRGQRHPELQRTLSRDASQMLRTPGVWVRPYETSITVPFE